MRISYFLIIIKFIRECHIAVKVDLIQENLKERIKNQKNKGKGSILLLLCLMIENKKRNIKKTRGLYKKKKKIIKTKIKKEVEADKKNKKNKKTKLTKKKVQYYR